MEIKKIAMEDLEPILDLVLYAELESLSITNPKDNAWIRNRLLKLDARGAEFYGVYDLDEIIGFATILVEDRPEGACDGYGACELLQLGIRDRYRKKGFGSKAMAFLEQELKKRKVYCLYMHTYAEDYDVIAFYGKNGFIPRGVVPHVYGPNLEGMLYLSKPLI